ncbi:hypothetical protein NRIC_34980 [Enterococcus florum]|uniref:LysR substrate-binding domain-containing protein n=1 Tax=Enterococcus florum TaxID=2480627 RepID=A0A4P5PBQ2_9ENTE|nr:hypothetical protein NRIC_34980 [Enterococcus florum]
MDLAMLIEPFALTDVTCLKLPRKERWGFLLSREWFLSQKEQITPADLTGFPILSSSRSEVQQLLADWAGTSLEGLNIIGHYNLIFNVFSLVESKVGAAFAIEGALRGRRLEDLIFLPLSPAISTHCVLVWKNRVHTPVVEELIRRFKHAFQA